MPSLTVGVRFRQKMKMPPTLRPWQGQNIGGIVFTLKLPELHRLPKLPMQLISREVAGPQE